MTALLDAPSSEAVIKPRVPSWPGFRLAAEHTSVASLLVWWALPLTRAQGGRGPAVTAVALVLGLVALVANDALRRISRTCLVVLVALPVAAVLDCLFAPTGWYGADSTAGYALAAVTVAVAAAYSRTPARRTAMVIAVSAAGLVQFGTAFVPWWGGEDPAAAMTGTFYWWNPFAAFLLPGALLGAAMAVANVRSWRVLGWFAASLCSAGIVFSSSRMTFALLVAGYIALLVLAAPGDERRRTLVRWVLVGALSVGTVFALSGPPVFPHRASPTAAADAKAATGQTVSQNGAYRLQFWQRAVAVVEDRPLVGSGAHGLVGASSGLVPSSYARSNLAHNGYLQALSDGGLLIGLPFLAGCLGALVAAIRLLMSARRRRDERWMRVALPVALGGSMAHSAVDFDWSHSSDLFLSAMLVGLVLSFSQRAGRSLRWVPGAALLATLGVAASASWVWDGTVADIAHVTGSAAARGHTLHLRGTEPFRDYRWADAVLVAGAGSDGPVRARGVSPEDLTWALDATSRVASVADDVAVHRARALVVLGDRAGARAAADELVRRLGRAHAGPVADQVAAVWSAVGDTTRARSLLAQFLVPGALDDHAGSHLQALLRVDEGNYDDLDRCAYLGVPASSRLTTTPDPGMPRRGVSCDAVLRGAAG